MKQRILGIVLGVGLSASAASAEPIRMAQAFPAMLPASEVGMIVRSAGFVPISPVMRRGDTYVLRATARDGREMRVVVGARSGDIMSASPVVAAGPDGERLGPYERMVEPPPTYVPPGYVPPPGPPPIMHENDSPMRRPLGTIPNPPPSRSARAVVPEMQDVPPGAEPPMMMREERGEHGLLPPPPERFPARVGPASQPPQKPAAKPAPAPAKRTAAAPPLPKPRPDGDKPAAETAAQTSAPAAAAPAASAPAADAAPNPTAPPPEGKVDPRSLPH